MGDIVTNAVGGLIANEATTIIVMVVKRINDEINLGRSLTREGGALEKLGHELQRLASLLSDASKKARPNNKVLLSWLTKVENMAYDAEDMFDEWSYAEIERDINTKQSKRSRMWYAVSYPFIRLKAAHDVRNLRKSIQDLYNEATTLGISVVRVAGGEVYEASSSAQQEMIRLRDQRQYVEQECVFGRQHDFNCIVELLRLTSNSDQKLNVIGIIGMGGLGKTTLSNKVSKSEEAKNLFDKVISIVVSYEYGSTNAIMKKIAKNVLGNTGESEEITLKLQEKLGGMKYLLMLDDVWNTTSWNTLSNALVQIGGCKGTTILVTSRERKVAENMSRHGKPHIHTLQGLTEPDSWSLFAKRITSDNLKDTEKYEIAKRMIKKCGGIPLAINLLGDLLRNNDDEEKWREFEKSKEWTTNDESNILASLRLSYMHLKSTTLKSCFSYCAIFGEDEEIDKDNLIKLWMAQGFLPKRGNVEIEAVGEECLKELLNNSLFHEPKFGKYGDVKSVKMHDLVRELACHISIRNNEGEVSGPTGGSGSGVRRHLSISDIESAFHLTRCKTLRTCLIVKPIKSLNILKDYKMLRALSFETISISKRKKDWEPLGNLKHLRYLEIISGSIQEIMIYLLSEIGKLYQLQTLILSDCGRVDVEERFLLSINLVTYRGGRINKLQNLNKLRGKLKINDIYAIRDEEEARSLKVGAKSSLQALELRDIRNTYYRNEILEALKPHDNLIELTISNFSGTRFPTWLTSTCCSLSNLVNLTLDRCDGEGELNMGNFTSLRFLELFECNKLTVIFLVDGFECCKLLEVVNIKYCYKVDNLPNLSPLSKLRSLTILNIAATSKLQGLDELRCSEVHTHGFLLPETISVYSSICNSLKVLHLEDDHDGYRRLKALPNWLGNITSLERLQLFNMPLLDFLSSSTWYRLYNLKKIRIYNCPLLTSYVRSTEMHPNLTNKIQFAK